MSYLFPSGRFSGTTSSGAPLVGGKLYTYVSGTTTNKATYTDSTLAVANTNPVILDARGEAQVWLAADGAYTFVLKDDANTTIWTVDGVFDPSNAANAAILGDFADQSDAAKGAGLIGYRGRTVYQRLGDRLSIEDAGLRSSALGSANLAALNSVIGAVREISVPLAEYTLSADPTNPLGAQYAGSGRLLKPVTGGTQQINLSVDANRLVFGQEYLYSVHNKFRARTAVKCIFSGDSTTEGAGITDPTALMHTLVKNYVADRGFYSETFNAGHSGATTAQWISSGYLAADLAALPDLYVIRWGINDPGWNKNGTAGTLDQYELEKANRRDASDFITSLRAGLATCRAAKSIADLAIIVMMPNSTSDSPNGRDEKWYEIIKNGVKQACRDYQCAFIDTYSLLADSRVAAGRYMDDPFGDGRAIHPLEAMNRMIAPYIVDLIAPVGLNLQNVPQSVATPAVTLLPNLYGYGISTWKVNWVINGSTVDGTLVNIRSADSQAIQIVYPNGLATRRPSIRVGSADQTSWLEWISSSTNTLSLAGTWVTDTRALTFEKSDGRVYLCGRIKNGSTSAASVVATLPAGYRPLADSCIVCVCGTGGTQIATLQVNTAGQIVILSCPSNALLDFSGASFTTY